MLIDKLALSIFLIFILSKPSICLGESDRGVQIYEKNKNAVCDVISTVILKDGTKTSWPGTGFFIDKDGRFLTADHVVRLDGDDPRTPKILEYRYAIEMNSTGRRYNAKMLGACSSTDMALLQVETIKSNEYSTLPFGDPDKLRVGETIWALGNPGSFSNTLTKGIVSYLHRQIGGTYIEDCIQVDCAVNSGNSGSPILNSDGEVVGMNQRIVRETEGINFAMSIKLARVDLLKNGHLNIPSAGFEVLTLNFARDGRKPKCPGAHDIKVIYEKTGIKKIDDQIALAVASYDNSAIVTEVDESGTKAGIKNGDLIILIDGHKVKSGMDVRLLLMDKIAGDKIKINFKRAKNGQMLNYTVTLTLKKRPEKMEGKAK